MLDGRVAGNGQIVVLDKAVRYKRPLHIGIGQHKRSTRKENENKDRNEMMSFHNERIVIQSSAGEVSRKPK